MKGSKIVEHQTGTEILVTIVVLAIAAVFAVIYVYLPR